MKKRTTVSIAAGVMACAWTTFAVPVVSDVTMEQTGGKVMTITYKLADGPAIVTLDIQTNCVSGVTTNWASIGGRNIRRFSANSDVWRKVSGKDTYVIKWYPQLSWGDNCIPEGGARAVVTAWAMDNPPDYMAVDLAASSETDHARYYPSEEFLEGGTATNDLYRTTTLLLKKVMAKNVAWPMGSMMESGRSANEAVHSVTLDHNYYIGVFQVTYLQWRAIQDYDNLYYNKNLLAASRRPIANICYAELRTGSGNTTTGDPSYNWPNDPNPNSFLGKLKTRTGVRFDLPGEAEWEFACRAGHGEMTWNDGSACTGYEEDANLALLGRYKYNGGSGTDRYGDQSQAAAWVGTYKPNSWGLYDMHGNGLEFCLDWYESDITTNNGAVNVNMSNPTKTLSGATGSQRVLRSGAYTDRAAYNRSAFRTSATEGAQSSRARDFPAQQRWI